MAPLRRSLHAMVVSGRDHFGLSPVAAMFMKAVLACGGVLLALRIIGLS